MRQFTRYIYMNTREALWVYMYVHVIIVGGVHHCVQYCQWRGVHWCTPMNVWCVQVRCFVCWNPIFSRSLFVSPSPPSTAWELISKETPQLCLLRGARWPIKSRTRIHGIHTGINSSKKLGDSYVLATWKLLSLLHGAYWNSRIYRPSFCANEWGQSCYFDCPS